MITPFDKKLIELGQAALDYYNDTGECLFCNTNRNFKHNKDCVLLDIIGKEYFVLKDIME